uniref:ANK_REP_REGION domain-containing protein n=1 Tax=Plectus sambesii TaxID=2011161 RepID=A0A914UVQ8_9BILA
MLSMSVSMTSLQRFTDRIKLFASRRREAVASSQASTSGPVRVYRDDYDSADSIEPIDKGGGDSVVVAEVDVTVTMSVVEEESDAEAAPPKELQDMDELRRHLELMHDRCIARNLRAAGLGTFEAVDEKKVYGMLSSNARMADTGESMLWAVINRVHDVDKQCRYVGILVVEKADVNEKNENNVTPLMVCCQRGLDKCAKSLLQSRKVDHALRDNAGNTALHYMAMHGRDILLKYYFKVLRRLEMKRLSGKDKTRLLIADDVFDIRNGDDLTPYQLAVRSQQPFCATLLEEEKSKRVKLMNKTLSLVQHIGSPSLSRSMQQGRKLLKRIASFDSLRFDNPAADDFSDEDLMLSSSQTDVARYTVDAKFDTNDSGMRPRVVTWHGRKGGKDKDKEKEKEKEKEKTNGSPLPSPLLMSGHESVANMSVNVGVRMTEASLRAQFFQSKGEMMRDAQAASSYSSTSRGMGRSVTVTGNLSSAAAKPKLTDRIRNFLRRKPRYGLHGSSSVDNLTAYRDESEQPPIGLYGDDIGYMRVRDESDSLQQRLQSRRKSSSLSRMEAMAAASRLKERQQRKISVNISASVQLPLKPE